ncbi:response regulator [Geomesophilobacter sediminis]|uniref:Response regulator n=1 Tax=Geomesophilobacter sediminis TaxID=2798584 RepID=A0A8J7LYM8_9BACT|nr:response regulator [Geomesophilobacter sediminis]MBJ6725122.1 response regulator [Geomesophilobacter sediminis]
MAKILVVDDSKPIRCMLSNVLTNRGFTVVEAADGKEAAELAAGSAFDVIITDVYMPEVNGIDLARLLRETPEHRFTPIVFLTTESREEFQSQGNDAGATAWLTKPFSPKSLIDVIRQVVPE